MSPHPLRHSTRVHPHDSTHSRFASVLWLILALVLAVSCSLDPWPLYPSPLLSPSFGGGRPPPSNSQGPLSVLAPDENLGPRRRQKMVGVGATDLGVHPQAFDDATCSRSLIDGSPTSSVSLTRVSPLPSFSPSFSP